MTAVLGIDAAWTLTQPSGVALVAKEGGTWRLVEVYASYQHFQARAAGVQQPKERATGSQPDASALLNSSSILCGRPVDLVAIDMPLSYRTITGRRGSGQAVSRAYGARKCSTHSPSVVRPGPISDELRNGFDQAGYPLLTEAISPPGLIEVYPHPAG